jgi:hypothetical protein
MIAVLVDTACFEGMTKMAPAVTPTVHGQHPGRACAHTDTHTYANTGCRGCGFGVFISTMGVEPTRVHHVARPQPAVGLEHNREAIHVTIHVS